MANRKRRVPTACSTKELVAIDEFFRNGYRKVAAARYAGYAHPGVQATRVFARPRVQKEIEQRRGRMARTLQVTEKRVVQELANIGFANFGDLIEVQQDGSAWLDMRKLTPNQRIAVAEFTVEEFTEGRGLDARDVRKVKLKFHDKHAALVSLARHLGMFNDQVTVKTEQSLVERLQAGRKRVAEAAKKQEVGK